MLSRKKASKYLIGLLLIAASQIGLAACGSLNPTPKPTIDVSVIAHQTVSAIYTQTAQVIPSEPVAIATEAATATPTPKPAEPNGTSVPAVETPKGVPQEPTRNVVIEAPNDSVTMEPYHDPTVEGPTSK
jgi:hypothetical protein